MSDADRNSGAWRCPPSAYLDKRPVSGAVGRPLSLYVTMPDGCRLAIDCHLPPAAPDQVPAILIFTPYYRRFALRPDAPPGTEASPGVARWRDLFVPRGYAVVPSMSAASGRASARATASGRRASATIMRESPNGSPRKPGQTGGSARPDFYVGRLRFSR